MLVLLKSETEPIVSCSFPRTGLDKIPTGDFKYIYNNADTKYNPKTNFSSCLVADYSVAKNRKIGESNFTYLNISGGDLRIKKVDNKYSISFDIITAKGTFKSSFLGEVSDKSKPPVNFKKLNISRVRKSIYD